MHLVQPDSGLHCERDAATILGYMLFEYSRLDMELGLFLVWSEDGKNLEGLTKKLDDQNFHKRLEFLKTRAQSVYAENPVALVLYNNWLTDADEIRSIRNQLFHGRWGFNEYQQVVANVVGLPTSPAQSETRYTLEQLRGILNSMQHVRNRLNDLRTKWPV